MFLNRRLLGSENGSRYRGSRSYSHALHCATKCGIFPLRRHGWSLFGGHFSVSSAFLTAASKWPNRYRSFSEVWRELCGIFLTHKIKAQYFRGKYRSIFLWENSCFEKIIRANFVLQGHPCHDGVTHFKKACACSVHFSLEAGLLWLPWAGLRKRIRLFCLQLEEASCLQWWETDFLPLLVLTRWGRSTGKNQYW